MTLAPFVRRAVVGFPLDTTPNGVDWTLDRFMNQPAYPVDVREDADHLYLEAELPGFKKDQIDITLENDELTIVAEHKQDKPAEPAGELLLSERRRATFRRTFQLPPTVDGSQVQAALEDGVLTVTLNKRQETKPRKISVG